MTVYVITKEDKAEDDIDSEKVERFSSVVGQEEDGDHELCAYQNIHFQETLAHSEALVHLYR